MGPVVDGRRDLVVGERDVLRYICGRFLLLRLKEAGIGCSGCDGGDVGSFTFGAIGLLMAIRSVGSVMGVGLLVGHSKFAARGAAHFCHQHVQSNNKISCGTVYSNDRSILIYSISI